MSDTIPVFKIGDRCQIMQTDLMVKRRLAARCGKIKDVLNGKYCNSYDIELDGGWLVLAISGCELNHISEEQYNFWKQNNVDTGNPMGF
ncbi:MAG: hypothetical protein WC389_20035 [Lutibacter sp.]|jgi:hypothetical protein